MSFVVYLIENGSKTYVGMSNDPNRRLRQHNSEIKGGARYTTSTGPGWKHVCIVSGFDSKTQALQFEWAVKHQPPRNAHGTANRVKKMVEVLNKKQFTSNAPPSCTMNLVVNWFESSNQLAIQQLKELNDSVSVTHDHTFLSRNLMEILET